MQISILLLTILTFYYRIYIFTLNVRRHRAAIQLVGLRHAKKGSTISEVLEIIGPTHTALPCTLQPHLRVGCRVRAGGPARATIDIP
jgi:hypothetical protein